MNAIDRDITIEIERAMRKVAAAEIECLPAETELARMADIQARLVARHEARIEHATESRKAELAELAATRKALREQHRADMDRVREQEQAAKDRAERSIRADMRLAAAARAAMKEIEG